MKQSSTSLAIRQMHPGTTSRCYHIPVRRVKIRNTDHTKGWWRWQKAGSLIRCWLECKHGTATLEIVLAITHRVITRPAITLRGIYPREIQMYAPTKHCTQIFTAAFICIAKHWQHTKHPSVREQLNTSWSIHTMGYYSVIRRNKPLIHQTTWMDLKGHYAEWKKKSQFRNVTNCKDEEHLRG